MRYSEQEADFIAKAIQSGQNNRDIAGACNTRFFQGRAIRTARAIEGFWTERRPLEHLRYRKVCEICSCDFRSNWSNARYCSEECRSVTDREYAASKYLAAPTVSLNSQRARVAARVELRWVVILKRFGDRCCKCRRRFPRVVYDLHHPLGKAGRHETPSRVIRYGTDEAFQKMLEQTELTCANCHRIEHARLGNWAPNRKDS